METKDNDQIGIQHGLEGPPGKPEKKKCRDCGGSGKKNGSWCPRCGGSGYE